MAAPKYVMVDVDARTVEIYGEHLKFTFSIPEIDDFRRVIRMMSILNGHSQEGINPVSYTHLTLPTKA